MATTRKNAVAPNDRKYPRAVTKREGTPEELAGHGRHVRRYLKQRKAAEYAALERLVSHVRAGGLSAQEIQHELQRVLKRPSQWYRGLRNAEDHDTLARYVRLMIKDRANKLKRSGREHNPDFQDVGLFVSELKIVTDALDWYEAHKEHAVGDPEPLNALMWVVHLAFYLAPLMEIMTLNRRRMADLRGKKEKPTNREGLDEKIAKLVPVVLRAYRGRGSPLRHAARELYRRLGFPSAEALRKYFERHHRKYF